MSDSNGDESEDEFEDASDILEGHALDEEEGYLKRPEKTRRGNDLSDFDRDVSIYGHAIGVLRTRRQYREEAIDSDWILTKSIDVRSGDDLTCGSDVWHTGGC